jgi:MFS family permease
MSNQRKVYPWIVLAMLFLVTCFGIIAANSMPPLFSEIVKEIPLTKAQMGAVMGVFPVAALFFSIIGGGLSDKIGSRWVIGAAALIVTLAGASRYFATTAAALIACMFFLGAGQAAFMSLGPKVMGAWFPRNRLATVMAIAYTSVTVGTAVALGLSARVLSPAFHGWRNTTLVTAAFCLAGAVAWLLIYRDRQAETGMAGGGTNILRNFKTILKIRDIWLYTMFYALQLAVIMSLLTLLPVTFPERGVARELLTISFIVSPLFKIVGAMVSDKLGRRKVFMVLCVIIPSLFIPGFISLTGIPLIMTLIMIGISMGVPPTMMQTAVVEMEQVGTKLAGTALGVITGLGTIGGLLGPVIAGKLMDVSGTTWPGFVFVTVLGVLAGLVVIPCKAR